MDSSEKVDHPVDALSEEMELHQASRTSALFSDAKQEKRIACSYCALDSWGSPISCSSGRCELSGYVYSSHGLLQLLRVWMPERYDHLRIFHRSHVHQGMPFVVDQYNSLGYEVGVSGIVGVALACLRFQDPGIYDVHVISPVVC